MADASVLGIHPPATVRIDMEGWVQDWPWDCVEVHGDEIVVAVQLTQGRRRVVFYPYEHARQRVHRYCDQVTGDHLEFADLWIFHGSRDFSIAAGPPQPASLN